jgi:hypothetical protein
MGLNICRDCEEGKHGACMGTTFIEVDHEPDHASIYEAECDCEADGHE